MSVEKSLKKRDLSVSGAHFTDGPSEGRMVSVAVSRMLKMKVSRFPSVLEKKRSLVYGHLEHLRALNSYFCKLFSLSRFA